MSYLTGDTHMTTAAEQAEEYSTVQLVYDHLAGRKGEAFSLKKVYTTQHTDVAFLALLTYYNDEMLLMEPSTLAIIRANALEDESFVVYVSKENVQVLIPYELYEKMVFDERWGASSYLECDQKLFAHLRMILDDSPKLPDGRPMPLHLTSIGSEEVVPPVNERIYTQAEVDELLAAKDA